MKKLDTRKLNTDAQHLLRNTTIRLLQKGKKYTEVAKDVGVHPTTVSKWWKLYTTGGYEALILKTRGVKPWTNSKLKFEQMEKLRDILIRKTPDELNLNFSLWTRQAIKD